MPPQVPAPQPAHYHQQEAVPGYAHSSSMHRPSAGAPFATLSDLDRQREASAAGSVPFTMGGGLHGGSGVANCLGFGGGNASAGAGIERRLSRATSQAAPYACDYQAPPAQLSHLPPPGPEAPAAGVSGSRVGRHVRPPHEIARAQYSAPWATDKDPVAGEKRGCVARQAALVLSAEFFMVK
jgi:hypothetical protein